MKIILILILSCLIISCTENLSEDKENLSDLAAEVNTMLSDIRLSLEALIDPVQDILSDIDKFSEGIYDPDRYKFYDENVYYSYRDDGDCQVLATGFVPVSDDMIRKIRALEHLGPEYDRIHNKYPCMVHEGVITHDSILVAWPNFTGLPIYVPGKLDLTTAWKTYWVANEENNPEKETIWVDPYIDAVGTGYMTSVVTPVYIEGFLEGVLNFDIAIPPISDLFLDDPDQNLLIITKESIVVDFNFSANKILKLEDLEEYYYLEATGFSIPLSKEHTLITSDNREIRELGARVLIEDDFKIKIDNVEYTIIKEEITELEWYIIRLLE